MWINDFSKKLCMHAKMQAFFFQTIPVMMICTNKILIINNTFKKIDIKLLANYFFFFPK